MESGKLIEYDILFLLAKYGEAPVLRTLASKLGISEPDLEDKLRNLKTERPRALTSGRSQARRKLEPVLCQYPEKAEYLQTLFARFQEKTFLPDLRDVKRFLDRNSEVELAVRSRDEATSKLFTLLGSLEQDELARLCRTVDSPQTSSLGLISDEILRRKA